jgi:lipoate-protein ligase A
MADSRWRLVISPAATGAVNMAIDEALLEAVIRRESPPVLRLYAWSPPCLSLGHAQPLGVVDQQAVAALGWDLVRRPTGGKAILHTDELTYSVVGRADDPRLEGGVLASYRRLSAGLLRGLGSLGLAPPDLQLSGEAATGDPDNPVCFEVPSPYELTWRGRKLCGSAQLRRRGGVLQHGSLPLTGDLGRICAGLELPDREQARRSVRDRAVTLEQALGRPIGWEEAAAALAQGFRATFGLEWIEQLVPQVAPDRTSAAGSVRHSLSEPVARS